MFTYCFFVDATVTCAAFLLMRRRQVRIFESLQVGGRGGGERPLGGGRCVCGGPPGAPRRFFSYVSPFLFCSCFLVIMLLSFLIIISCFLEVSRFLIRYYFAVVLMSWFLFFLF